MPGSTTARPLAELANFSDGAAASFPYVIGIMACQNKDFEILKGLRLSRWFPDFLIHTTQTAIRTATMAITIVSSTSENPFRFIFHLFIGNLVTLMDPDI